jgi:hypothetical protein
MPFEIGDKIRDGLRRSDGSETSPVDVDRPDDVTIERVRSGLTDAIAGGDLAIEDTEFNDESDLLEAIEPMVQDYCAYHDCISLLIQFQGGWESDTYDTYSGAINEEVSDEAITAVNRRAPQVVSVLEGFEETNPVSWTTNYGNRYPYFGCLVEYLFAYSELEDQGYFE